MRFLKTVFLLLGFIVTSSLVMGQVKSLITDSIPEKELKNLDIYLVIGQSNMAGRAQVREVDQSVVEQSFLFTGNENLPWVKATNPLNRYSTARKNIRMQRLSIAYSFAQSIVKVRPDHEIGLVVNAKGGTKIVQWLPGTVLYEAAIEQTKKALKYGKLRGIIWHQGEGDCDPLRIDMYLGRMEVLINAIREEFGDQTIPFVAGQLYENERRKPFNDMLLGLPEFIRHTGVATSEGTNAFDGTHYDSESAILLGNRYADEMLNLLEKSKK
jgi:hypothetical protein